VASVAWDWGDAVIARGVPSSVDPGECPVFFYVLQWVGWHGRESRQLRFPWAIEYQGDWIGLQ